MQQQRPPNFDYRLKVLVTGDRTVGKTSFISRFADDIFPIRTLSAIGIDFKMTTRVLGGKAIMFQIMISSYSSERYRSLNAAYFRSSSGVVISYDCSNLHSFASVSNRIEEARSAASADTPIVLVAMKSDLPNREVAREQGELLAQMYSLQFFETSSKENVNVTEVFAYIGQEVINQYRRRAENFSIHNLGI